MDHDIGFNVMSMVRAVIATILATTLAISIIFAELDESKDDGGVTTDATGQEVAEVAASNTGGPLNFDSTFLLLTAAIVILVVPDAIAYFRRKQPSPASKERDDEVVT